MTDLYDSDLTLTDPVQLAEVLAPHLLDLVDGLIVKTPGLARDVAVAADATHELEGCQGFHLGGRSAKPRRIKKAERRIRGQLAQNPSPLRAECIRLGVLLIDIPFEGIGRATEENKAKLAKWKLKQGAGKLEAVINLETDGVAVGLLRSADIDDEIKQVQKSLRRITAAQSEDN